MPDFRLASPAFQPGGSLPAEFTCDGRNVSPPLQFDGVPDGTAAFALVVRDTDAHDFVHWVVPDIPAAERELEAGSRVGTAVRNSFGGTGYGGPCPPSGVHHYVFTAWALAAPLQLSGTLSADGVERAASVPGAALAKATLTVTYRRGGG